MRNPGYLARRALANLSLPALRAAAGILLRDLLDSPERMPGREEAFREGAAWLLRMQNGDGGFASHYALAWGREDSFPEVTGYIVPTLLELAKRTGDGAYRASAVRAGEYLLRVQNEDGSVPSYATDGAPLVFDTGQAIFGLLALHDETRELHYVEAARRAGSWIVAQQDPDGSWRKFAYNGIPHTYYSRVSWGLLKLWQATEDDVFRRAAIAQLDWTVAQQDADGFFRNCSFAADGEPALHVVAYTIEGLLQSGYLLKEPKYVEAAKKAAAALRDLDKAHDPLFGFYRAGWQPAERSRCLTGLAQMSCVWSWLYEETGDVAWLRAARGANRYLRTRYVRRGPDAVRGGLGGSFPAWGRYMPLSLPVWAMKFWLDALLLEERHGTEHLSVAVFPNEPCEQYLAKGEMRKGYWNPAGMFAEVHVFDPGTREYAEDEIGRLAFMAGDARLVIHPIGGGIRNLPAARGAATRIMREAAPDVVRTYGLFANGLVAYHASRATRTPLVVSLHTNYWWDVIDMSWRGEKRYLKAVRYFVWHLLVQRRILRQAARVVAMYPFAARYALEQGVPESRTDVVYNRVDESIFNERTGVPKNGRFTVLTVGRLMYARYQEAVIRAIAGIPDADLVLVGQGPDEPFLKALVKELHLSRRVTFIPRVENRELSQHYARAHVYATPNRFGGIEIPVIEAMACGLPIVRSKHAAEEEPDLLGFAGCVYVENSPAGFREGILRLKDDPKELAKYADRSRAVYASISGSRMSEAEREAYLKAL